MNEGASGSRSDPMLVATFPIKFSLRPKWLTSTGAPLDRAHYLKPLADFPTYSAPTSPHSVLPESHFRLTSQGICLVQVAHFWPGHPNQQETTRSLAVDSLRRFTANKNNY